MTYKEQLQDIRWLNLRAQVIRRDFGVCQNCMGSRHLNVHHKEYIAGRMAWEYPKAMLITLCNRCHHLWHEHNKTNVRPSNQKTIEELGELIRRDVALLKGLIANGKGTPVF